jgi:hypothetical protein
LGGANFKKATWFFGTFSTVVRCVGKSKTESFVDNVTGVLTPTASLRVQLLFHVNMLGWIFRMMPFATEKDVGTSQGTVWQNFSHFTDRSSQGQPDTTDESFAIVPYTKSLIHQLLSLFAEYPLFL